MNMPRIISRIFDPLAVFVILIIVGILQSGIEAGSAIRFFLLIIFGILTPPVLLLTLALKKGWVSGWDISDRKERVRAFSILFLFLVIDAYVMRQIQTPPLASLFIAVFVWFLGFFLFTLRWKLSGHVGVLTLAVLSMIHWFGFDWWPLLFLIPLLSWARVAGKYHTSGEVIGGALYSIVYSTVLYLFSSYFS